MKEMERKKDRKKKRKTVVIAGKGSGCNSL
jgi:hypothetical protein